ncbi:MAG TPA: hypothetical protein VEU30_04815, partial [Thermoanaerobaculia bacterium]|nr:hypothetical protein [Thermoanaerobaculia bacterium]
MAVALRTHGDIDKLAIYEKLGVEEVWYWRKGIIEVYVLSERKLVPAERSRLLPDLDLELLASMLDRDTLTQAVRRGLSFQARAGASASRGCRASSRRPASAISAPPEIGREPPVFARIAVVLEPMS